MMQNSSSSTSSQTSSSTSMSQIMPGMHDCILNCLDVASICQQFAAECLSMDKSGMSPIDQAFVQACG